MPKQFSTQLKGWFLNIITIIVIPLYIFAIYKILITYDLDKIVKYLPLATFVLACIAFFFALRTYWRKSSISVKASYIVNPDSEYSKAYIQSYTLESEKDKALIIFRTYLKIGYDTYILLDDFKGKPLILKAYEVHHREFVRIDWHIFNEDKVDLTKVLNDSKIQKSIVLSTSHGKYVTKTNIDPWYAEESYANYNLITGQTEKQSVHGYANKKAQDFKELTNDDISKNFIIFSFRWFCKKLRAIKIPNWFKKIGG